MNLRRLAGIGMIATGGLLIGAALMPHIAGHNESRQVDWGERFAARNERIFERGPRGPVIVLPQQPIPPQPPVPPDPPARPVPPVRPGTP